MRQGRVGELGLAGVALGRAQPTDDAGLQAIDLLVAEDYLDEQEGPRNARLLVSVKPFRKPEDDES